MAKLVLDVEVKGAKQAEKEIYKIGKASESVEKTFKRLGTTPFLKGMPVTVKKMNESFTKTQTKAKELLKTLKGYGGSGFKELIKDEKTVLKLTGKLNDEFEKQARLQFKLAKQGKGTPQQNALAKQLKTLKKQTKELQKQTGVIKKNTKATKKMSGALGMVGKIIGGGLGLFGIISIISSIQSAISGLVRSFVRLGVTIAKSFFAINTHMEQLRILMNTAAGSIEGGARSFERILEFATKAPFSVQSLADSFVKLKTAGIDPLNDGTLQILSDSVAAFGGSSEQLRLVTIAIQQMVGKGVVSMEELRRQFGEQVPTAMRAMAQGLEMSILNMFDLISKGGLDASKGIAAMLGVLREWHGGASEKRMQSMQGAMALMRTEWSKLMIAVAGSNNLWEHMVMVVKKIATTIGKFTKSDYGQKVIGEMTDAMNALLDKFDPKYVAGFLSALTAGFKTVAEIMKKVVVILLKAIQLGITLLEKLDKGNEKYLGQQKLVSARNARAKELSKDMSPNAAAAQAAVEIPINFDTKSLEQEAVELGKLVRKLMDDIASDGGTDIGIIMTGTEKVTSAITELKSHYKAELTEVRADIEKTAEAYVELVAANDKLRANIDSENFQLDLSLKTDDQANVAIMARAEHLKGLAEEISLTEVDGAEKKLAIYEKIKSLYQQLAVEADAVTKSEVAAAKRAYEEYYKISRGGMAGGSANELEALRQEYKKLAAFQKAGKADTREESRLKKEQVGLQKGINNKILETLRASESLKKNEVTLAELREKQLKEYIAQLDNMEKEGGSSVANFHTEWINYVEKVMAAYKALADQISKTIPSGDVSQITATPKAKGGPVFKKELYLVGEKGPELFLPDTAGNIIPSGNFDLSSTPEPMGFKEQRDAVDVKALQEMGITPPDVDLGSYQKIMDDIYEIFSAPIEVNQKIRLNPLLESNPQQHADLIAEAWEEFRKPVDLGTKVQYLKDDGPADFAPAQSQSLPDNIWQDDAGTWHNETKKQVETFDKLRDSIKATGDEMERIKLPQGALYQDTDGSWKNYIMEAEQAKTATEEVIRVRTKTPYQDTDGSWKNYIEKAKEAKVATEDVAQAQAFKIADKQLGNMFDSSKYKTEPGETMVQDIQAELDIKPTVPESTREEYNKIVKEEERKMAEAMANFKPYQIDPVAVEKLESLKFAPIDAELDKMFGEIDASKAKAEIKTVTDEQQKFIDKVNAGKQASKEDAEQRKAAAAEATAAQAQRRAATEAGLKSLQDQSTLLANEQAKQAEMKALAQSELKAIEKKKGTEGDASTQAQENLKDVMVKQTQTIGKTGELHEVWTNQLNLMKEMSTVDPYASVGGGSTDFSPTSMPSGRYAGGPVSANTPYIVGEKGPELFVPNNSGNIVPNNELRNGETTEINLSFNGTKVGPMFSTKQVAKDVLREFEIMQGALS